VVEQAVASTSQLFKDKGVALEMNLPRACPLLADRDRLVQVMLNLLSNAVKFVERGKVRWRRLALAQTGEGMRVDVRTMDRPHPRSRFVFEKFRQGGNTMTDKPQGTGSACRSAVRSSSTTAVACGWKAHPAKARHSRF
jgi:signal transduction histidine kinase